MLELRILLVIASVRTSMSFPGVGVACTGPLVIDVEERLGSSLFLLRTSYDNWSRSFSFFSAAFSLSNSSSCASCVANEDCRDRFFSSNSMTNFYLLRE